MPPAARLLTGTRRGDHISPVALASSPETCRLQAGMFCFPRHLCTWLTTYTWFHKVLHSLFFILWANKWWFVLAVNTFRNCFTVKLVMSSGVCTCRWDQLVLRVLTRRCKNTSYVDCLLINRTRRRLKKQLQSHWWSVPTWLTPSTLTTRKHRRCLNVACEEYMRSV